MNYRRLKKGEVIQAGDEIDSCPNPWKDTARWEKVSEASIGDVAPDPAYPAHRQYRRPITSPLPMMCERDGCNNPADYDCQPIPGTTDPGWENEPTARCKEHSKGLMVIGPAMTSRQHQ